MPVEEEEWAVLVDVEAASEDARIMVFNKPSEKMTKHLKPLYIKAHINGKAISRVIVVGRDVLNVMPMTTRRN